MAKDEPRLLVGWPCPMCGGTGRQPAPPLTLQADEPARDRPCSCENANAGRGNVKAEWLPLSKVKHMLDDA